jgi:hypothetical protein
MSYGLSILESFGRAVPSLFRAGREASALIASLRDGAERRQLKVIRDELDRAHTERTAPAVKTTSSASPLRLSSKART